LYASREVPWNGHFMQKFHAAMNDSFNTVENHASAAFMQLSFL
jgi:hypothetical protein